MIPSDARKPRRRHIRQQVTPSAEQSPWPAVRRVSVLGLFGKYDYVDLKLFPSGPRRQPLALIYGANGSGKTTLLKLLYATLSPSLHEGLKTYMAQMPFRRFELELLDGTAIQVAKLSGLTGAYRVEFSGSINAQFDLGVDSDGAVMRQESVVNLSAALRDLGIDLLYVRDDRKIQTTYGFIEDDEEEEVYSLEQYVSGSQRLSSSIRNYVDHGRRTRAHRRSSMREVGLFIDPVIGAVNEWIKDNAYRLGSTGDQDASLVYLDVLRAFKKRGKVRSVPETQASLRNDVMQLSRRAEKFVKYGLISQYPFREFIDAVSDASPSNIDYMSAVLSPFVDSIKKRLNALESLQEIVERLETSLNSYFRNKRVEVDVLRGMTFHDEESNIEPSQLSSGERQLVFLFSAALLSRDGNSIFIVDEPELSLNFEWQRTLVKSILDLSEGGRTQFIMASHSIEILTKHKSSIVKLG